MLSLPRARGSIPGLGIKFQQASPSGRGGRGRKKQKKSNLFLQCPIQLQIIINRLERQREYEVSRTKENWILFT